MLRMTPYDAQPEAMTLAEAVCVVCDKLCGEDGIVVVGWWEDEQTPVLPAHRGRCDDRLDAALERTGAFVGWWDLPEFARYLSETIADPPTVGVVDADGGQLLRRKVSVVNLRRTADVIESL